MEQFCRIALGLAPIKAKLDNKPVLFGQALQYLRQTYLIRKLFLRRLYRNIHLTVALFPVLRSQTQRRLRRLDSQCDILHAFSQLLCQLRQSRLCSAKLAVMLPGRIDAQAQFFE